jgi:hypothetical protein
MSYLNALEVALPSAPKTKRTQHKFHAHGHHLFAEQSKLSLAQAVSVAVDKTSQSEAVVPGLHDLDFLSGYWQVHHRKLRKRLANGHQWVEFEGTLFSQPLLGGTPC